MNKRILIVEDEQAIAFGIRDGLQDEGFETTVASSGEAALRLELSNMDLVLLDIRLPGIDGYEVCRQIRNAGFIMPVLFVSARDDVMDRVVGLELGADDFIVKPFSFRELLSRVNAHLRRAYGSLSNEHDSSGKTSFGEVTVDKRSMRVFRNGEDIYLTPIEYRMLMLFLDYPSQVLTRDQIIEHVWGDEWAVDDPRSVNVHLRHLREKLEDDPSQPKLIITIRGYGYRFDLPKD